MRVSEQILHTRGEVMQALAACTDPASLVYLVDAYKKLDTAYADVVTAEHFLIQAQAIMEGKEG